MPDPRSVLLVIAVLIVLAAPSRAIDFEGELSLNGGYRGDDIRLKGESCFCDEVRLKFKNSDVTLVGAEFYTIVAKYFYMRGAADFGWYQDSDFRIAVDGDDGDGPQPYRIRGDANGDWTVAVSGGLGLQMGFLEDKLRVGILGGYAYDRQELKSHNEKVTLLNDEEVPDDPFPRVKWRTEWWGPWTGLDLSYQVTDRFRVMGSFEYHWTDFDGKLRLVGDSSIPDSVSQQSGDGDGYIWGISAQYRFYDWLHLRLKLRFQEWDVDTDSVLGKENTEWTAVRFSAGFVVPF